MLTHELVGRTVMNFTDFKICECVVAENKLCHSSLKCVMNHLVAGFRFSG